MQIMIWAHKIIYFHLFELVMDGDVIAIECIIISESGMQNDVGQRIWSSMNMFNGIENIAT